MEAGRREMIIHIKAKPNSGKQEIVKVNERQYRVNLKSKAEDGKANLELIKVLGKYFKKEGFENIKIIKGLKSRNKVVEVK